MHQSNKNKHIPVLIEEVIKYLDPQPRETYLDMTAGYGGHATAVLERTSSEAVLVDRDANAVEYLKTKYSNREGISVMHKDFLSAAQLLKEKAKKFDLLLADLGVSSPHLNIASRGFAISKEGPLDMRMDNRIALTAEHIVNTYSEDSLVRIFRDYGEEKRSKRITHEIIRRRPLYTTTQLADLVCDVLPKRGKVHPATKIFQALRIAVNDELSMLTKSLPVWADLLKPKGRIVVISFHSLEDRIVKNFFRSVGGKRYDAELIVLTKRPVSAQLKEVVSNPRARSAKLRAAVKK